MAKTQIAGFRFAEPMMQLLTSFADFLGITKTRLVEDSLRMGANVHSLAAHSHNQAMQELVRRYGPDAPITITVIPGDQGDGKAVVLIDGLPPDDVITAISIEHKAGRAHVFLDLVGWYPGALGTVALGPDVLITRPMMATAKLPWPPDPTLGLVARLGDLVTQTRTGKLIKLPAVEQAV
jgi:hypothetical protein